MDKGERVGDEVPEADKLVRAFLVVGGVITPPPQGDESASGEAKKSTIFMYKAHINIHYITDTVYP